MHWRRHKSKEIKKSFCKFRFLFVAVAHSNFGSVIRISELTTKFYSLIPHSNQKPIDSTTILNEKISTLEALSDIIVANRLMKDNRVGKYSVSPIDVNYKFKKKKFRSEFSKRDITNPYRFWILFVRLNNDSCLVGQDRYVCLVTFFVNDDLHDDDQREYNSVYSEKNVI